MAYASGKNAWGISDRSGRRYRLRTMKREWTGALVGPDEFEPKHPQLFPPKAYPDPQALRNPRPDRVEPLQVYVGVPLVEDPTLASPRGVGQVGFVTIAGDLTTDVTVEVTGVASVTAVGSVSITVSSGTWDSTGETLDSTAQTYDEG